MRIKVNRVLCKKKKKKKKIPWPFVVASGQMKGIICKFNQFAHWARPTSAPSFCSSSSVFVCALLFVPRRRLEESSFLLIESKLFFFHSCFCCFFCSFWFWLPFSGLADFWAKAEPKHTHLERLELFCCLSSSGIARVIHHHQQTSFCTFFLCV